LVQLEDLKLYHQDSLIITYYRWASPEQVREESLPMSVIYKTYLRFDQNTSTVKGGYSKGSTDTL